MPDYAEFRSSRAGNIVIGVIMFLFSLWAFNTAFFGNEADFLSNNRGRGQAFFRQIEQVAGWDGFRILLVLGAISFTLTFITAIWKCIGRIPDAKAFRDYMEFHPGIKESPIRYEEVVSWSVGPFFRRFSVWKDGQVLFIRLNRPYWSFQTAFWQRRMRLVGSRERLEPIVEFLSQHPVMGPKRVK